MIPKIKKSIKKFLLDESGNVSKKSLLKIGLIVVVASSMAEDSGAAVTCAGNHCNLQWGAGNLELTPDQQIIVDNNYGNLVMDRQMGLTQCEDGTGSVGHNGGQCDGSSSEHCNCAIWWCKCSITWDDGVSNHESHFSSTNDWECYDRIRDSSVDHWNAAHHVNSIDMSSEDNLIITAEHGNYVATVNEDIYAYDLCGSQHSSAD